VGLAAQEGSPGEVVAVGRGLDAVGYEDLPDGGGRDVDSQGGEFAVVPPVTPAGVVACQAQDEGADAAGGGRPAGLSGATRAGVVRRSRSRCQRRIVSASKFLIRPAE
jgi:hypothetical protein